MRDQHSHPSYRDAFAITASADPLEQTTSALLATVAGTVTIVTEAEHQRKQANAAYVIVTKTLPIGAGVPLPIRAVKVTAMTATGVFGLV